MKAEDPSSDDGTKVKAARGDECLTVRGDARHQLHPQVLGIGRLVVQNADQLSDGLIFEMPIVVAEVVCRQNQRKISISLQKDRRWRDVIPISLIAVLKRQAAEMAEPEFFGRVVQPVAFAVRSARRRSALDHGRRAGQRGQ